MPKRTDLSGGSLNGSDHLKVELIEPTGKPAFVVISWPSKATVCTPAQLDAIIAAAMRIPANSLVTLAGLRVQRKL